MIGAFGRRPFTEQALLAAAAASAALLAGAHVFQALGYPPCPLCLDQREAHWTALAVAGAGLIAHYGFKARLAAAAAAGATALVYAVSTGLAAFHVGVEFRFWPGPASCSGGGGVADAADLMAALSEAAPMPGCADASWRLFGISMAGYNMLFSAGLFALTFAAALAATRDARRRRRAESEPALAETAP